MTTSSKPQRKRSRRATAELLLWRLMSMPSKTLVSAPIVAERGVGGADGSTEKEGKEIAISIETQKLGWYVKAPYLPCLSGWSYDWLLVD
jgi:hypothetical protein